MRTRPIMTGGYLRPTLFNGPLPRLVPQPLHITGMITARRAARERRVERFEQMTEQMKLIYAEYKFEDMLATKAQAQGATFQRVFTDDVAAWRECSSLFFVLLSSADDSFCEQANPFRPS